MSSFKIPGTEVKILPLSQIDEGERYRKDYGDLSDLKNSIQKQGLINPITCCQRDGKYLLVAGGRRLAALKQLKQGECLVRIFTNDLTDLDLRIIELAENLQRKEMTWSESNNLQREIHRLQQEKYGVAKAGGSPTPTTQQGCGNGSDPEVMGWRMQDTADMLGISKARVSESIRLADKFEQYKEVLGDPKNYKTENDARKAVKIVEESILRAELTRRAQKSGNNLITSIQAAYKVGDAFELMSALPAGSFDFIECDPPYGIALNEVKKSGDCANYNEIDATQYLGFTRKVLKELYRLLKDNAFCFYWFGINPWFEMTHTIAEEVGFQSKRLPALWVKPAGQSLSPDRSLANAYETAFVFRKGDPVLAKPGRTNVFSYTPMAHDKKYHPTQKPLPLYQDIYETFSFEGAQCLTPFAGSGASILAAYLSSRKCIGFDLSPDYKKGYDSMVAEEFLAQ